MSQRRAPKSPLPTYGSIPHAQPAAVQPTAAPVEEKEMSARELLALPAPRSVFMNCFMLAFVSMAWEVVFTLFSYTRVSLGGIQRSVSPPPPVLTLSYAHV